MFSRSWATAALSDAWRASAGNWSGRPATIAALRVEELGQPVAVAVAAQLKSAFRQIGQLAVAVEIGQPSAPAGTGRAFSAASAQVPRSSAGRPPTRSIGSGSSASCASIRVRLQKR